jgi:hypothetical protein
MKSNKKIHPNVLTKIRDFILNYDYVCVFFALFFIYNIITRVAFNGDTKPAALLPRLIIQAHTVYFDTVYSEILRISDTWGPAYQFVFTNGHYASIFPIVTGVLVTPIYFLNPGFTNLSILSKFSATILVAFAGTGFYLLCKELFTSKIALISTIVFALGTSTWAISSQSLWQHGTSELLLIIAIFCIVRNELKPSILNIGALGVVSGLYLFNRPPDALLLIPIFYYIWLNRKKVIVYLFGFFLSGFPFLYYNVVTFGNFLGGYGETPLNNLILGLNSPLTIVTNFSGQFISANRGLLIFSPILIFAIWGYYLLFKSDIVQKTVRLILLLFLPFVIGTVLIYSTFPDWGGGWSYGPRYLTGVLPILAIYTGYGISPFFMDDKKDSKNIKVIRYLIVTLIIISIIIEAIGAWGFPYSTWDSNKTEEKLWDWSDPVIISSYNAGLHLDNFKLLIWPSLPPPLDSITLFKKSYRVS